MRAAYAVFLAAASVAVSFLLPHRAAAENIVFPTDAGVIDLTAPPYNARGDGRTDCTAAIQKALQDHAGADATLYLPNGTYIVSDTIRWQGRATRNMLQGQSMAGTIIRLKDDCPGFTSPAAPRAVINTGFFPPQRFRNAIRNLTVDTGRGNYGAIGVQFNASNQGQMNTVTIRSGDGAGLIGLDMGYTGDVGPLLVKRLTVEGFDIGIYTAHATAAQTLEDITLMNQRVCGWVNDGQTIAVRKLRSVNAVTAFRNKRTGSMAVLLDAVLEAPAGREAARAAIVNEAFMYARNVSTAGYEVPIDATGGSGRGSTARRIEEFVSHDQISLFPSPARALHLPVEETPDLPWDDPATWVSVAKYPPQEKTITKTRQSKDRPPQQTSVKVLDWTESIQRAIDSGAGTVYFPQDNGTGKPYEVLGTVHVRGKVRRIIGMEGRFGPESRPVFQIDDGESPVVLIERFDWIYTPTVVRVRTGRAVVVGGCAVYLDIGPGAKVFVEDVVAHMRMAAGARVWMRQWNTEYTHEARHNAIWPEAREKGWDIRTHPGNLNDGGTLWALGFKTEGDGTLITSVNGAKTEVLGGLVYANKADNPAKRAFVVRDSDFSLSIAQHIIRNQPFNMVEETRDGETRLLLPGMASTRGFVLYSGQRGPAPATRPAHTTDSPPGNGSGLRGEYYAGEFDRLVHTRTETVDFDWSKTPPVAGERRWSVRWTGQLEARRSGPHGFRLDQPGMRLLVGDTLVADAWRNNARYRTGSVVLEAGKRYDIKLEYRCDGPNVGPVRLVWQQPGLREEVVPAGQLHPAESPLPEVRLTASAPTVPEGGRAAITARRTGGLARELVVPLAGRVDMLQTMVLRFDARGDAVEGVDYRPLPPAIVIPAGADSASIEVEVLDDRRAEPTKKLILEAAFSPAFNVAGGQAVLAITDDDLPPAGAGSGLRGEYFAGRDFTDLKVTRVDPVIDFAWDQKPPAEGLDPRKGYAVRWTGQLEPLFTGTYRLSFPTSKYGALTVWLDGAKIMEVTNPGTAPGGRFGAESTGLWSAMVPLTAGRRHDLRIDHVYCNFYGAHIRMLWSSDSQFEQVVPASQLHALAQPAGADGRRSP